jgi:hypothetical protein
MVKFDWPTIEERSEVFIGRLAPLIEDVYNLSISRPEVEEDKEDRLEDYISLAQMIPGKASSPTLGYRVKHVDFQVDNGEIEPVLGGEKILVNYENPLSLQTLQYDIAHELGHTAQMQNSSLAAMVKLDKVDENTLRSITEAAAIEVERSITEEALGGEEARMNRNYWRTEWHRGGSEILEGHTYEGEELIKHPEKIYQEITGINPLESVINGSL